LDLQSEFLCLFDSLNCHTRNQSRSCISRSTSQSHSLSDSISQRASLFTYHLVCPGYSPAPPSRNTLTTHEPPIRSRTDYVSSGSGYTVRTDTFNKLATVPIPLTSSRTCHRHVTPDMSAINNPRLSAHPSLLGMLWSSLGNFTLVPALAVDQTPNRNFSHNRKVQLT
jgi:hypothetical protein